MPWCLAVLNLMLLAICHNQKHQYVEHTEAHSTIKGLTHAVLFDPRWNQLQAWCLTCSLKMSVHFDPN